MTMCYRCGQQRTDNAGFCPDCGEYICEIGKTKSNFFQSFNSYFNLPTFLTSVIFFGLLIAVLEIIGSREKFLYVAAAMSFGLSFLLAYCSARIFNKSDDN